MNKPTLLEQNYYLWVQKYFITEGCFPSEAECHRHGVLVGREQMREECEIAINPHASYLGDEVIDIIKELK